MCWFRPNLIFLLPLRSELFKLHRGHSAHCLALGARGDEAHSDLAVCPARYDPQPASKPQRSLVDLILSTLSPNDFEMLSKILD